MSGVIAANTASTSPAPKLAYAARTILTFCSLIIVSSESEQAMLGHTRPDQVEPIGRQRYAPFPPNVARSGVEIAVPSPPPKLEELGHAGPTGPTDPRSCYAL